MKKKQLSRIALLAEERTLTEEGRQSVKEAAGLKAANARRRKINSLTILCDDICREGKRISVTYDDGRTIVGMLRRDGEGFILAGEITSALWLGAIKLIKSGEEVLWEES